MAVSFLIIIVRLFSLSVIDHITKNQLVNT